MYAFYMSMYVYIWDVYGGPVVQRGCVTLRRPTYPTKRKSRVCIFLPKNVISKQMCVI